ncbi:DUF7373 family lipoprotein (plasmid) [Mycolicibacterium aichiense]|uniref:DUF7373 family lipoprotein n=1 Tax=Mycolicibacterium aichiense TaxID=1799 RepID=UPI003D66AD96
MTATARLLTLAAAASLIIAGCSTTRTGQAIKDPAIDAGAPIPALLNPGAFPTTAQPPLGTPTNATYGAAAEARRMGENTVLPFQVDPTLTAVNGLVSGPLVSPSALLDIPLTISRILNQHNFVGGFVAGAIRPGSHLDSQGLTNFVFRMAAPDDAAAAVADVAAHSATMDSLFSTTPVATAPIPIPGHPEAAAFTFPGPESAVFVWSLTAHGPFVLMQWAGVPDAAENAAGLAGKTLDQQAPLIDAFAPTPVDQLTSLPLDPTGVLARTVPVPDGPTVRTGSYTLHAALATQDDPRRSQDVFSATGVDVVTRAADTVYRARNAAAAAKIVADFAEDARAQQFTPAAGVLGLPAARCLISPQGDLPPTGGPPIASPAPTATPTRPAEPTTDLSANWWPPST